MPQQPPEPAARRTLKCAHCEYSTLVYFYDTLAIDDNTSTSTDSWGPEESNENRIHIQEWDYEIHLSHAHRIRRPNQLDVPHRELVNADG